jgi:hypothetical protein
MLIQVNFSIYTLNAESEALALFLVHLELHPPPLETGENKWTNSKQVMPTAKVWNRFWLVREFWKAASRYYVEAN